MNLLVEERQLPSYDEVQALYANKQLNVGPTVSSDREDGDLFASIEGTSFSDIEEAQIVYPSSPWPRVMTPR